jgi:hypothetical protein
MIEKSDSVLYFERNPKSAPYLERLVSEWKQHGKIIIAVDFDDTISPWKMEAVSDFENVIFVLKEAHYTGAYIVIFTACNADRFDDIRAYCKEKHLPVDAINQNPIDLPYGNHKKIYANIFIDDRAGLNESLEILQMATYRIRSESQPVPIDAA